MLNRRLRTLRYAGLAASAVLAAGGYLAGALPAGDPGDKLRLAGLAATSPEFRWGTLTCLAAAVGWLVVWGRLASAGEAVTRRWLTVTGLLWSVPLLLAPPLGSRDAYSYACQGWLFGRGSSPYLVSPAGGGCPALATVAPLWRETTAPYGPFGVVLAAVGGWPLGPATGWPEGAWPTSAWPSGVSRAWPIDAVPPDGRSRLLLAVTLLRLLALAGVLLAAAGTARLAAACGASPVRAVVLAAASPLVAVHAISGAHNDAVLAGLVVAALAVLARPGPLPGTAAAVVAGAGLGLACSIKITAAVVIPFAALLAVRRHEADGGTGPGMPRDGDARRPGAGLGDALRALLRWPVVALALAAGVGYLTVMVVTGLGFGWVSSLGDTAKPLQWTSAPTAVGMSAGYLLRLLQLPGYVAPAMAVARVSGAIVLAGIVLALWLRAWRRRGDTRTVLIACGGALAAVVLLSPVWYPWYALTPVALFAATATGRLDSRRLVAAGSVLTLLVLPNGLGVAALTKFPGAVAVTLGLAVGGFLWWRRRHRVPAGGPVDAASGTAASGAAASRDTAAREAAPG